ncbi:MAG TPA: hypothetical protein PKD46_17145 [Aggregatilineaceae bacterium]|nr:hypothetical protein [Aggregatilineaceae bacterium]
MLSLILGWINRYLIPIVLAGGVALGAVGARWFYLPAVERANERAAALQASVDQWARQAKSARAAADRAQREAAERGARLQEQVEQLRRDLAARTYKDESCDDAAAAVRQQWRSR